MGTFLYNASYGQTGGVHTMKPQYEVRGDAVYRTIYHPEGRSSVPDYKIRGDQVFTTETHSAGIQANPWFTLKNGNEFHNTIHHPEGVRGVAAFHMK